MEMRGLGSLGRTPTEKAASAKTVLGILRLVWLSSVTVKSNAAREYALEIAMAASEGLITTRRSMVDFGDTWNITPRGIELLWEAEDIHEQ